MSDCWRVKVRGKALEGWEAQLVREWQERLTNDMRDFGSAPLISLPGDSSAGHFEESGMRENRQVQTRLAICIAQIIRQVVVPVKPQLLLLWKIRYSQSTCILKVGCLSVLWLELPSLPTCMRHLLLLPQRYYDKGSGVRLPRNANSGFAILGHSGSLA